MAYLILENGAVFKGETFGYETETVGELVFTTGMNGFLETLTDPASSGQILLQTFPVSGSYGVIPEDLESDSVHVKAYIVREWCQEPSNFRSEGELDTFLRRNKIPGLCGVDTRAITRIIRSEGTMNAVISHSGVLTDEQKAALSVYKTPSAEDIEAEPRVIKADNGVYNAVLLDLGCTRSFIAEWQKRGVSLTVTDAEGLQQAAAQNCDGVIISNGRGDPSLNVKTIAAVKTILNSKIPILGVGLGHLILALANGAETEKLHFGHRGANQPVRDVKTGRVFVTEQNHGYTVTAKLPPSCGDRYQNRNDGTIEGLDYTEGNAFSVQFNPGSDPEGRVYDRFISLMEEGRRS